MKQTLLGRIGHELVGATLGGSTGAGIGYALGGPLGGMVGSAAGVAMGKAVQAAREAGIQNVDHLVSQAMLNPDLARVLLAKVTPQNQASVTSAQASQLKRLSLVSTSQQQDERRSVPLTMHWNELAAAVASHSGAGISMHENSLFSRSSNPATAVRR